MAVSFDDCLVLRAVGHSQSLREAAQRLGCDPSGLLRKVQRISLNHGLVRKVGNRWKISNRARALVTWTEESIQRQNQVLKQRDSLRICSTTWFMECLMIPRLHSLQRSLGKPFDLLLSSDSNPEEAILEARVDFAVLCHPPESPLIAHRRVFAENWSIYLPVGWGREAIKSKTYLFDALKRRPFIRHPQLNPDLFFEDELVRGFNSSITIDNMLGIRSAISHGLGWSCLPDLLMKTLVKEQRALRADRDLLSSKDRQVCVWWLRNRSELKRSLSEIVSWVALGG